ncbi:MAG: hypothetical protein HOE76_03140 [Euryarchaeota archaeon]|jgi:hypothetical protein|nr:hypothetical protein [Euryarchaeota archaeon]MBT4981955.1 hypothetical protein [Euryarchaeota archaeon]MBT5184707.1 hypothetical protein [Euryarchaeota archaeon]
MNNLNRALGPAKAAPRAFFLVAVMILASMGPILSSPLVSAHDSANGTIWPKTGSEDTGWVLLNATGADAMNGTQAYADWLLNFAPGATLENVSLEIRADGSNGVSIQQPLLLSPDTGQVLFDWRGNGWLGQTFGFDANNPHQGRLSTNADVGATVTLPSGSEITDFILEVLAPADPFTSLEPVQLYIRDYEIHPVDGRMYMAIGSYILILDANSSPNIIDLFQIKNSENDNYVTDLEMDVANNQMLVTTATGVLLSVNLADTSWNADLPMEPSGGAWSQAHVASNGDMFAFSQAGIFTLNSAGTGWTLEQASGTTNWPSGDPWNTLEHNGIIYSSLLGGGVGRWDVSTMTPLSPWSTANNLHSDYISGFLVAGNQLLISSFDAGIARRDLSGNFWLATWNSGNWLSSDAVKGMTFVNNQIQILTADTVHVYNTNSGTFASSTSLSSIGQVNEGQNILYWPSSGSRSPVNDTVLVTDGSAILAMLEPGSTPLYTGDLVIGSGPNSGDMHDAMQFNGIIYVGSDSYLDRYSISQARWLSPVDMGGAISQIVNDGVNVLVGTLGSGIHVVDSQGNVLDTWDTADGLQSDDVSGLDAEGDWVVAIHPQDGASAFNQSLTTSMANLNEGNSDLDSDSPTGVAIHNGVAYIGTTDDGLNRYIIANDTFLGSWVSTGINDVDFAPVAVYGTNPQILHMGLPGYGVARKDLSTGEILIPLTVTPDRGTPSATEILPSNQVYALAENTVTGGLFIGTGNGAVVWNGNSATELTEGSTWNLQPSQHFDFAFDGSTAYSATNIGVCKYTQTSIQDCQNAQDGMPNWGVYAVGINSTTIFGGTTSGVGLIDKSTFSVTGTWEAGEETENALVVVIDDVAYIGLNGIGVARYDIPNNNWLTTWDQTNLLDAGNEDVTGLVADFRPDHLWVGGGDGFQLINVTSGTETYDIEKNDALYSGNGDPYDLAIYGDTLYYHQQYSSDSVYRIDIANFTAKSELDAGAQVDENGGDVYGLEIIGDVLHVSVASGQWWNTQGSGGIGLYNLTTDSWQAELMPSGSVNRVTSFISSTGTTWVSWGESKLEAFAANGSKLGEWDSLEFPIREIVEFNGEILFATEDGVARYDENTSSWLTTWTPGSGLPNSADDAVYELWTNGTDLVVGTARTQGWNGVNGEILHLDAAGAWTSWDTGSNGIPNGYPIGMVMCAGIFHVAITANNGGVARFDLANGTIETSFTSQRLDDGDAAAVACDDSSDILYVGYYDDQEPISRFDYNNDQWLSSLSTASHNIPSDPVWWGAMEFAGGKLAIGYDIGTQGSNVIGGGYVLLSANGATVGAASILSTGSAVSSIDWLGTQWLIGQAGGTSGYSHVDTLGQLGQNTIHALPNLVSGQVTSMAGNQTHIWVASASWQNTGSGVLQGLRLSNGSVEWQKGWTIPANAAVTDIQLVGTDLYLASNNRGLRLLDTLTGTLQPLPTGIHNFQDGLALVGDDLFIGLQGSGTSSAGIQVFNTTTNSYTAGRLLAGLPSNNINGFLTVTSNTPGGQNMVYIATNNGVGRWNATGSTWETAWTALDGLPISYVEDIIDYDNKIWMATPNGVSMYDSSTASFTTFTPANGLMGTSSWSLVGSTTVSNTGGVTQTQQSLFIAHDGRGTDRPGITQMNTVNQSVIAQHQFDQLPSNMVTAVTADMWGVHIATDIGPLVHWVRSTGQFNSGSNVFTMEDWPVYSMRSDGSYLIAVGENGATVIQAGLNGNSIVGRYAASDSTGGSVISNSYVVVSTANGLKIWTLNTGDELEPTTLRRADPLSLGFQLQFQDVSNYTHPGMQVALVDSNNSVTLGADGTSGAHGILMQNAPLTFSSPISGAATWAKLVDLKWNATVNLSEDPTFITSMQYVIDNGVLLNGTRHVNLRVNSPSNGSMWVKLTYDWFRTETPIQGLSLWDRPDDGGSTLMANWTLVHDDDFSRYLVYLNEGPWASQPTAADLQPRSPDASVSLHSRLQTEISNIDGQPLQDGIEYWAVVVVEYNDGRFGIPSMPFGPATPTDEVPTPPIWATAVSGDQVVAVDGEVFAEWARCAALDLASTRVYASTTEISDALGLSLNTEIMPQVGNVSTLTLEAGKPHWLAFTCVDESGQEDLMNATVIGPVVPTGGVNDGVPPPKLTGVWAEDVPADDGGRVQIGWDNSVASDCAYVVVYMMPVDPEWTIALPPTNVDGMEEAAIVPDCETNMTIVDSIGEASLIDGQNYWIGAVAYDKWLNGDTGDVTLLEVTPYVNNIDGATEPDRISELNAWDHPGDDGTAIDISWSPSEVDDFDYYVIWTSVHPLDDLTEFWQFAGTEPGICGCIVMDKQWIDTAKSPLELTLNTALYGGDGLTSSLPGQIMPDVELYVAITVHDIKGNVYLDNLNTVMVTPIDNLADITPPGRLEDLSLYDMPNDDGTAVQLEFALSDASDVAYYEVYAAAFSFTSVGVDGNGPETPIITLDRTPELPLTIEILAYDALVIPNLPVTVAVVAVDSSGNAYRDNLVTSTAIAIDDGVRDKGAYLPDIEGLKLQWISDSIMVTWDHSTNPSVRSYIVFISDSEFSEVADATMVGEISASNTLLITPDTFITLSNESAWWVGVAAKDSDYNREIIDSKKIDAIGSSGDGDGGNSDDGDDSSTNLGELLSTDNLILMGLVLITVILLVLVLRGRGGKSGGGKDWDLQEATWGIQARDGWDDAGGFGGQVAPPVSPPPAIQPAQQSDIYAAAQRIQEPTQPVQQQQPQRWTQPVQQQQPAQGGIDTSFLDDLL